LFQRQIHQGFFGDLEFRAFLAQFVFEIRQILDFQAGKVGKHRRLLAIQFVGQFLDNLLLFLFCNRHLFCKQKIRLRRLDFKRKINN
jgi:hypothetical protein